MNYLIVILIPFSVLNVIFRIIQFFTDKKKSTSIEMAFLLFFLQSVISVIYMGFLGVNNFMFFSMIVFTGFITLIHYIVDNNLRSVNGTRLSSLMLNVLLFPVILFLYLF